MQRKYERGERPQGAAVWKAVQRAAEDIAPAEPWRQAFAERLHEAVGGRYALVFTCPLSQPERGRFAVSAPAYRALNERIMREYLPRLERSGEGWARLYRRYGVLVAVLEALAGLPVAESLRADLLAPEGIAGYLCAFFVTPRGELAGWFVIATTRPEPAVLAELSGRLRDVAACASRTLAATFNLAESCGASFPEPPVMDPALSAREREVVALVLEGLSDSNIASRLSIRETTVGSHLHRVYAKLGVHSRMDLLRRSRGPRS